MFESFRENSTRDKLHKLQHLGKFKDPPVAIGSTKGKCAFKTFEVYFKGLTNVPIYVRSVEKLVSHLVWAFFCFGKNLFLRKKVTVSYFCLYVAHNQILTKIGSKWWSKHFISYPDPPGKQPIVLMIDYIHVSIKHKEK